MTAKVLLVKGIIDDEVEGDIVYAMITFSEDLLSKIAAWREVFMRHSKEMPLSYFAYNSLANAPLFYASLVGVVNGLPADVDDILDDLDVLEVVPEHAWKGIPIEVSYTKMMLDERGVWWRAHTDNNYIPVETDKICYEDIFGEEVEKCLTVTSP